MKFIVIFKNTNKFDQLNNSQGFKDKKGEKLISVTVQPWPKWEIIIGGDMSTLLTSAKPSRSLAIGTIRGGLV